MFASTRAAMRSENLEDLTEAELKMKTAEFVLLSKGIVDDLDEQRFVAATLAIVPHSKVERINCLTKSAFRSALSG